MTAEKTSKSQDIRKNIGSSPPGPPAKDDASKTREHGSAGALGRGGKAAAAAKDRPINISTADDVDIDKNIPGEDAGQQRL